MVVPFAVSRDPLAFYELLRQQRVTVLNQTPSAFWQLSQAEEDLLKRDSDVQEELALRLIIFGGEALELQKLKSWFERHGDERPQLVNMYGITETTVHVTYQSDHTRRFKCRARKCNRQSASRLETLRARRRLAVAPR